jgi:lysozyme family protein
VAKSFDSLRDDYTRALASARVRASWRGRIDKAARFIVRNRRRYERIEARLGVPWAFIGVLHWRESSGSFTKHLHNGDSLTARTRRIPRGYPRKGNPPFTWEYSAEDALRIKGLQNVTDWSIERICYEAERFNGFGYLNKKRMSPYLWNGTTLYERGKYVRDEVYDGNYVDQQVGCIPVYQRAMELAQAALDEPAAEPLRKIDLNRVKTAIHGLWVTITGFFTLDTLYDLKAWVSELDDYIDRPTLVALAAVGISAWVLIKWCEHMEKTDGGRSGYASDGSADGDDPGDSEALHAEADHGG